MSHFVVNPNNNVQTSYSKCDLGGNFFNLISYKENMFQLTFIQQVRPTFEKVQNNT